MTAMDTDENPRQHIYLCLAVKENTFQNKNQLQLLLLLKCFK